MATTYQFYVCSPHLKKHFYLFLTDFYEGKVIEFHNTYIFINLCSAITFKQVLQITFFLGGGRFCFSGGSTIYTVIGQLKIFCLNICLGYKIHKNYSNVMNCGQVLHVKDFRPYIDNCDRMLITFTGQHQNLF